MKKQIRLVLPKNPTVDEKVEAIESILDQFIDKRGRFNVQEFAKKFRSVQEAINKYIPDWENVLNEIPLYADDFLSQKFRAIFNKSDPDPLDFTDLARNVAFDTSGTKQFSANPDLDWCESAPPINEEVILYINDTGLAHQAKATVVLGDIVHFKNLGIGGDFNLKLGDFKWLKADRFNPVESTPEVQKVMGIRGFSSSESQNQLSNLIKTYI